MNLNEIVSWILHVDRYLNELITYVGPGWMYVILFAIVFCETGLVLLPFLPGDSLLFAVGAMCAIDQSPLSLIALLVLLIVAAVAGDAVNYWIGFKVGPAVFRSESSRWFNRHHLERAQQFYEKYGAKTIILARFVPIVRTFAPFVAGIGRMNFTKFWLYNVVGGITWVSLFLIAGYYIGSWKWIKENFFVVTILIILISVVPIGIEWWKSRTSSGASKG